MMKNLKNIWKWTVTGPWIEREQDTEYKYEVDENSTLWISFMGSSSVFVKNGGVHIDWKQNFNFIAKPYSRMSTTWFAHRGFVKKWRIIEKEILNLIKKVNPKNIHITGFSQGAAVATLAHESVWFNFPERRDNLKTTTFASPRVVWFWNCNKVEHRWANVTQVKNKWDIVPSLPPLLFGYRHIGGKTIVLKNKFNLNLIENHLEYF